MMKYNYQEWNNKNLGYGDRDIIKQTNFQFYFNCGPSEK